MNPNPKTFNDIPPGVRRYLTRSLTSTRERDEADIARWYADEPALFGTLDERTVYGTPSPLVIVAALVSYHPARVAVALAAYAHRHPETRP